tara:strand:+ start:416 stop:727 length:312 start_codon:yes stop_codon:yes gene_type:complete
MQITNAPVISLTEIPSIKDNDDECTESYFVEVNAQIEHEHLVKPAVYNPPELSHPDEYKTVIVDATTEIEFEDDEDRPFTLKGWLKYLNKNSHSITWIVDTGV